MERVRTLYPEDRLFFSRWLQNPLRAGAFVPSGSALARLMAAQVDPARPGVVVELGGGTGTITDALLKAGIAAEDLMVIEQDERLHEMLARRFQKTHVVLGDAGHLGLHLNELGLDTVNAVVSGLPLLLMSRHEQWAILEQVFAHMDKGGVFAQFTYGLNCPVPRSTLRRLGLKARSAGTAWRNIPPAIVWRFTRA